MSIDKKTVLAANIKVQEKEAPDFDEMHPELFSSVEKKLLQRAISHIKQRTDKTLEKVAVLDIACGTGRLSRAFLEAGFYVTAVDLSPDMLAVFKQSLPPEQQDRVAVTLSEIHAFIDADTESYDCIMMGAFLHHVNDIAGLLKKIITKVRTDGFVFILHDPVLRNPRTRVLGYMLEKADSVLFQLWYAVFKRKLLPRLQEYGVADVHTQKGIDDDALAALLGDHGFQVVEHKKYFSHKTKIVTFLDRVIFKCLPQFCIIARKE